MITTFYIFILRFCGIDVADKMYWIAFLEMILSFIVLYDFLVK